VTPSGPLRTDAEDRLWARLEKYVDDKQKQTNERFEPILSDITWLRRLIIGGFFAALAQYLYQHAK